MNAKQWNAPTHFVKQYDSEFTYCGVTALGLKKADHASYVTCKRCLRAIAKRERELSKTRICF